MANSFQYHSSENLGGLFLNFVKVTIMLAFIYMVILKKEMNVEPIGGNQAILLDVTDRNIINDKGDFSISAYAAKFLGKKIDRVDLKIKIIGRMVENKKDGPKGEKKGNQILVDIKKDDEFFDINEMNYPLNKMPVEDTKSSESSGTDAKTQVTKEDTSADRKLDPAAALLPKDGSLPNKEKSAQGRYRWNGKLALFQKAKSNVDIPPGKSNVDIPPGKSNVDIPPGKYMLMYRYILTQGKKDRTSRDYPLIVDYNPVKKAEYNMYVVAGQWNFLPPQLQRPEVDYIVDGYTKKILGGIMKWEQTKLGSNGWASQLTGNYTAGDSGSFTLSIMKVLNLPPAPIRGSEISFVYNKRSIRGVAKQDLQGGYQNWCFVLSDYIIDPDGIEGNFADTMVSTGQVKIRAPKPNHTRYRIDTVTQEYQIVEGNKITKGQSPYTVFEWKGAFPIYVLMRKANAGIPLNTSNKALVRQSQAYEQFEIVTRDPEQNENHIAIKVYSTE